MAYTASKGALNALCRAMAVDEAAHGVRVNSIAPGSVDTPMLRASAAELPIAFFTSEQGGERVERARTFGPIFAKPEGIDDAIAWVVSRS